MGFHVETSLSSEGTPVVAINGEVDVYTAPQMRNAIHQLLDGGTNRIVVDLTHTSYLDSTALGVLVGAMRSVRERDGSIVLACPSTRVRRVFELTGLDNVFEMYDSVDKATEAK